MEYTSVDKHLLKKTPQIILFHLSENIGRVLSFYIIKS